MGFFYFIIMMVISFAVSEFLGPKPAFEDAKPADIGDFSFPTATEGRVIPVLWGTCKFLGPNVIWYGDLRTEEVTQKVSTGMFSSKDVTTGHMYHIGIQFAICLGVVDKILQIRVGEKTAWSGSVSSEGDIEIDEPMLFGGEEEGGGIKGRIHFHTGTPGQSADGYLSKFQKRGGVTPAYPGICYCTFEQGYISTSPSIKPWEFVMSRFPAQLNSGSKTINTHDCNPINLAYEIFIEYLGIPEASIDQSNFNYAATVCVTEKLGFSMVLDNVTEALGVINMIEEHVDGVFYVDPSTGKWKINLIRGGYTLADEAQLNDDNIVEIREFTRGAWEDTINEIRVEFTNRNDEYQKTFAIAQDPANIRIQGNRVVTATVRFPGVKLGSVASYLAFRELRSKSYPLAKCSIFVNREYWNLVVGSVVSFSSTEHGIENMPMRVQKADRGNISEGVIQLDLIQDVFTSADASYGSPESTEWTTPIDTLIPIPAIEQLAFEAPKALVVRDPAETGPHSVWCSGRAQNNEQETIIRQRNSTIPPSGSFYDAGRISKFLLMGTLLADMPPTDNVGTFQIVGSLYDSESRILEVLEVVSAHDAGQNLQNLIMIGDEFFLPLSVVLSGNVYCQSLHRGALDSVASYHLAGDPVYIVCAGGSMMESHFTAPRYVDVKLLPTSQTDQVNEGSAVEIDILLANRALSPYPPGKLAFNGSSQKFSTATVYLTSTAVAGISFDGYGFFASFQRRDYRRFDEIENCTQDAAYYDATFPAADSTVYKMECWVDPDGTPALVFTTAWNTGLARLDCPRNEIYAQTEGVLPSRMRVKIHTKHTVDSVDYEAIQLLVFDFPVNNGSLEDDFNLGVLDDSEVSNAWTAPEDGSYTCTLAQNIPSGIVEYQINSGGWNATGITGTTKTGTIPGVVTGDLIYIRHTGTTGADKRMLLVGAPAGTEDAYGILIF